MKRILLALAILALAAALWPGLPVVMDSGRAEAAAGGREGDPIPLAAGAMATVDLDRGESAYRFVAPTGSVYDVWLFPAEGQLPRARATLWRDDRLVAEGEGGMQVLSLRLAAGSEYVLRLSGRGRARLEVARHALSRCFAMPMELDASGDTYAKAFARSGDAHWYAVEGTQSLPLALVGLPVGKGLRLEAMLFDEGGRLLAEAARTVGGAFLLDFTPAIGRRCCLRVTAQAGATGLYELRLSRLEGSVLPDRVTLSRQALTLDGRESALVMARVSPEGAGGVLYWESSDSSVARVDDGGRVTGRGVGAAVITAYAAGGVSDRCLVEVRRVDVTGVALLSHRMALSVGDDAAIECEVLPENASDPTLTYEAAPAGIVEIDPKGVLWGLSEGTATVMVRSADGGFTDEMTVEVGPAPRRWRALLVGEQNYASTVAPVRTGSVNSVAGLRSMLENLSFDGARFRVEALLDVSRDAVLAGIDRAFGEAGDGDMSLFYITCHGYYAGGMTCLQMYDGSVLTAAELAGALREVKGDVLVVIDCCGSGGVIGRASSTRDILKGIDGVFGGVVGPAVMGTSRFHVLASAALEQESYRVSFGERAAESRMATVFARALCEAGGWRIDQSALGALRADLDFDGQVTLGELREYAARRVMWYLNLTGTLTGAEGRYVQSVQAWPEGDDLVVFAR